MLGLENECSARRGATSTGLSWVVVVLLVLVAAAVWFARRPSEPTPAPTGPATATDARVAHPQVAGTRGDESALTVVPSARVDSASPRPPMPADASALAREPARFEGRGRIRGEITAETGTTLPERWTLHVEPHPTWVGRERAARRALECTGPSFVVEDLPLAAYLVRAEAEGRNGSAADVLLVKSSNDVHVQISLRSAGLVDGIVLSPEGAPAEDLIVILQPKSSPVRATTRVAADGTFVFRDVIDGEYTLTYGPAESPLVPAREIVFRSPTLRAPQVTLPPTGSLRVRTVDARGQPVPDVEVDGFGAPRGALRVTTGFDGKAAARWLAPGTYRLEGRAPDGRKGKISVDVPVGPELEVVLQLRER